MINIERAKLDPASFFKTPHDVLIEQNLTIEQKIDILRRWSYDEREMSVAEEENMPRFDNHVSILDEILKCLLELGVEGEETHPPTKHG
jgi:hypothetical protein